ncbi:MAG: GrpB family protein [Parachlamydiaceae bacterium]
MEANCSEKGRPPKRIMIFGIPGSGKSTFSLKLSRLLNIPLFHLDKYFFLSGWQERGYEEFLQIQKGLVDQDSWVIDGNATKSFEMRFSRADTVIYFRFNRILCLSRIFKRLLYKHPQISDRAEGCTENIRFRLIKYLWGFPQRVKQSIEALRLKYPEAKFYEFQNDDQAQSFLTTLKKSKKYTYKPYSNTFPSLFQKEKKRISSTLHIALAIEHVGSTSIPGLSGKGIIDIAISASKEKMEQASQILQKLGYEYRPTFSTPERFYFIIYLADSEEGNRRYHIHLTYPSSKEWKELIGFRDYLKHHPEAVNDYAILKRQAADMANQDGELYRKMKEPMFQKINALIKVSHDKNA